MYKYFQKNIIIFLVLFIIIFIPNKASAQNINYDISSQVIINELYPHPNPDEKEWIEIFNNSEEVVNLNGWILMDELSSPSIIYEFVNEDLIEPLSFLTIDLSSSKLNNSGDTIKLIDNNQEVIDQFGYSNSELEKSFSLTEDGEILISEPTKNEENLKNSGENNDDNSETETEENSEQEYPNLFIYKVTACPTSENPESIEIENPNDSSVNLNNWQIKDLADNKIVLTENETIPQLSSTTISLTKSILNNSGDTVFLFDPNDKLTDQYSYESCETEDSTSTTSDPTSSQDIKEPENPDSSSPENTDKSEIKSEDKNKITNTESNLKKINALLKTTNFDKSETDNKENYVSQQIIIPHKDLPKTPLISVIIGGAIISSSGLLFIKTPKLQ